MEDMAHARLERIRALELQIRRKRELLKELRASAGARAIAYDTIKVQTTATDTMSEACIKAADLEAEIRADIRELVRDKNRITDEIFKFVTRLPEQEVLYQRYVKGENFKDIAERMNYTIRSIFEIRNSALRTYAKALHLNSYKDDDIT